MLMPSEKDKILEFNQYMKPDKMPCNIHADIEYLLKKIDGSSNNPESSLTTKIGEYILGAISTVWAFDHIENKHTFFFAEKTMKQLWESLKQHTKKYD